ncbi:MAG: hypothetical protein AAF389_21215 [Gemmatimonadota bacterium]
MFPVLPHTRASCAAQRSAEELCGDTGFSLTRGLRVAITALFVVATAACGNTEASSADAPVLAEAVDLSLRFAGSAGSLDQLGSEVLRALTLKDEFALDRYRLSEAEHNEVIWPELPASAPEVNFPVDYAWENIQNRNQRAVARLGDVLTGPEVSFLRAECRGVPQLFETFRVETDCWVVYSKGTPELWEIQAFKDVLVRGGGRKVFRYYDEEPRPHRTAGSVS